MSYNSLFSEIDFLTNQPSLYIFQQSKYSTLQGSVLSFLVLLSCLGFIIYFLIAFFQRNDFSIVNIQESTGYNNSFNLSDSMFYISFLSQDLDASYHFLNLFYYNLSTFDEEIIQLETCTEKHIPERYRSMFNETMFNPRTDLCLVPGQNITVSEEFIFLEYYYCNQILDDNCHTYNEVFDALYNNMAISLHLQNFDVDHYDVDGPFKLKLFTYTVIPGMGYYHLEQIKWQVITYETDRGYIFEDIEKQIAVHLDQTFIRSATQREANSLLARFEFNMYEYGAIRYRRTFEKLQSVIANVGVIISVIQTIGQIIVMILTNNLMVTQLAKIVLADKDIFYSRNNAKREIGSGNGNKIIQVKTYSKDLKVNASDRKDFPTNTELSFKNSSNNNVCHLMLNKIKNKSPRKDIHIEALNNINFAERVLFSLGMRSSKGLSMIELSQRITKEALSCEQIIKTNIAHQKLMQILDETQREKYYSVKPDFFNQIDSNNFIRNNV